MSVNHVAIIMDGNGRWAKLHGVDVANVHAKGAEVAEEIIKHAASIGVKHLTLYAFSTENWNRPETEISALMDLLSLYLESKMEALHKNNIRFKAIGDLSRVESNLRNLLLEAEIATKDYGGMCLYFAFSYGGRDEIVRACKKIVSNKVQAESITEESLREYLDAPYMPDVDLMIRSGGDVRISNFLIWQNAYAELYFTERLWPDFKPSDLEEAIAVFRGRKRNFGCSRYNDNE